MPCVRHFDWWFGVLPPGRQAPPTGPSLLPKAGMGRLGAAAASLRVARPRLRTPSPRTCGTHPERVLLGDHGTSHLETLKGRCRRPCTPLATVSIPAPTRDRGVSAAHEGARRPVEAPSVADPRLCAPPRRAELPVREFRSRRTTCVAAGGGRFQAFGRSKPPPALTRIGIRSIAAPAAVRPAAPCDPAARPAIAPRQPANRPTAPASRARPQHPRSARRRSALAHVPQRVRDALLAVHHSRW